MAITHFGSVGNPVDSASAVSTATQITITPPTSMTTGDLVVVYLQQRGTATFSVGVTGGQTWNSLTRRTGTNIAIQGFWCRYNGTWGANPRFDFSAGTCTSAVMHVWRPTGTSYQWATDQAEASGTFTAGTTPFTKTRTGVTNAQASTVTLAGWFTADDNTWGSLSGTGWSQSGMSAQYRNTSGSDQSAAFAYKIQSASGATGNVSINQATLGGDAGVDIIVSFYEYTSTTYDDTLSESVTGAASESAGLSFSDTLTESVTGAASESSTQTLVGSVSDSVTAASTESSVQTLNDALSEAATTSDTAASSHVANSSVTDALTAGDSISGGALYTEEITDAVTPGELSSTAITAGSSITEAAIFADDFANNLVLSTSLLDDAALAYDTDATVSAGNQTYNESLSESASLSDAITHALQATAATSESTGLSDNLLTSLQLSIALSEDTMLADDADGVVVGGAVTYDESVSESLAPAYSLLAAIVSDQGLSEDVSLADAATGDVFIIDIETISKDSLMATGVNASSPIPLQASKDSAMPPGIADLSNITSTINLSSPIL